jgi:hypothetical protein
VAGALAGAVLVIQDNSEHLRSVEVMVNQARALREQAQMLDLANILIRAAENRIVFWNRGAEQML